MTAQEPNILINDHPSVAVGNLNPYFILRGDIEGNHEQLALPVPPNIPEKGGCSSLWRGYIATFRLAADGTLKVVSYDFPYAANDTSTQTVADGIITGDFWLVLRPFFDGPNTSIPFRGGRVVEDRSEWKIDDQTLHGRVDRKFKESGLIVDVDCLGRCFMPRSLISPERQGDLDSLVGCAVSCEFLQINKERNCVVVRPIKFVIDSEA